MSAETHRRFFTNFVKRAAALVRENCKLYEHGDAETLRRVERLYAVNGMPGCVGSTDCVRECVCTIMTNQIYIYIYMYMYRYLFVIYFKFVNTTVLGTPSVGPRSVCRR